MGPGRLELPTLRLSSVHSNQLSYEPLYRLFSWSMAKLVRHPFLVWKIEGSSPSTPV